MVIIDSSVAFKWLTPEEPQQEEAFLYLEKHLNKTNPILVPSLIFYELTNAWACKGHLTIKNVKDNIGRAKEYKLSAYDAIYIALAQKKKCNFVTADQKLVSKVNLPFVKTLQ